jgi:integrase
MAQAKITISSITALKPGEIIWDSEVRGFGARCQRRDRVYIIKKRVNGKQRQFTIGTHGSPWTPVEARNEARRILGEIASGQDLHSLRAEKADRLTVAELAERYLNEYAIARKKQSSVSTDRSNLRNHVLPYFGDMLAAEVTIDYVNRFLLRVSEGKVGKRRGTTHKGGAEVAGGKGVANRCRALLSKMFNLAEQWRIIPPNSNPVKHSLHFKEGAVERYLRDDEMERLGTVLARTVQDETTSIHLINAIRLLLLTGARLGEVQNLKWEHIDQQRKVAFLPDSKTGRKPLPLSDAALELINATPRLHGNPYVFAGRNDGSPIVNFRKPWARIRKEAGLGELRLHDLRHNFASAAINAGTPLAVVGALLGHKNVKTTQRYAHLAESVVHEAGNATARLISAKTGVSGLPQSPRTPT